MFQNDTSNNYQREQHISRYTLQYLQKYRYYNLQGHYIVRTFLNLYNVNKKNYKLHSSRSINKNYVQQKNE